MVLVAAFPHVAHREAVGASNATIWVIITEISLEDGKERVNEGS
jgi:hypothetical protein